MYRTVTVPLNSINILAQEQFGSGGLAEVKILYNFMDEILWVLNNERHCRGWHCNLVRHFWQWIMTVGSKLNGYGYESNVGCTMNCTIMMARKKTIRYSPSQFTLRQVKLGQWKYAIQQGSITGWHVFLIYNCHCIVNTDTLIFWYWTWQTE